MAGKIITNSVQLGDSITDSQNFLLTTNIDGTAKLSRGAAGTLGDILTINSAGVVTLPGNITPVFSVYQSTLQSIAASTAVKVQFQSKEFDNTSAFDATTNYRFQPTVAGYYQANWMVFQLGASETQQSLLYKNGIVYKAGAYISTLNNPLTGGSALVYLNGSTDYIEIYEFASIAGNTVAGSTNTYFQGYLVARG
jgi:hypothetical protein